MSSWLHACLFLLALLVLGAESADAVDMRPGRGCLINGRRCDNFADCMDIARFERDRITLAWYYSVDDIDEFNDRGYSFYAINRSNFKTAWKFVDQPATPLRKAICLAVGAAVGAKFGHSAGENFGTQLDAVTKITTKAIAPFMPEDVIEFFTKASAPVIGAGLGGCVGALVGLTWCNYVELVVLEISLPGYVLNEDVIRIFFNGVHQLHPKKTREV